MWSLLLGFASLITIPFFLLPLFFYLFFLVGPFAIWTGQQSQRRGENSGMATAGIILGALAIIGGLIGIAYELLMEFAFFAGAAQ